jgi:hypothetical protein
LDSLNKRRYGTLIVGGDPQLERAVTELMRKVAIAPKLPTQRPADPVKVPR